MVADVWLGVKRQDLVAPRGLFAAKFIVLVDLYSAFVDHLGFGQLFTLKPF